MRTKIIGAVAVAVAAFAIAGCGKSSGTASKASTGAAVSEAPSAQESSTVAANTTVAAGASAVESTTVAPAGSSSAPSASTAAAAAAGPACTGLGAAGSGTAADVKLVEWGLEGPASVKAGAVTLNITNTGNNKHNLAVVKGTTWANVPKSSSGGVDVTKVAKADLLGTTAEIDGGKSCSTTLTLDAGSYVLFCSLGFGGNSHAARGQHFDLTVG